MSQVNGDVQVKARQNLLNNLVQVLDKVGLFSRWTNIIGIVVLFLMVCLTFADVIMRYIFNSPITGVTEVIEVMLIAAVFLGIAHTQNERGHVNVDIISGALSPMPRFVLAFINNLLGLSLFIVIISCTIEQIGLFIRTNSSHSQYLTLPDTPFGIILLIGCTALSLLLLRDLLKQSAQAQNMHLTWYHWLLMIGVPAAILVMAVFWMQPDYWSINRPIVGLIGVIASLIFFFMGMPIAFALILTSFLFIGHIRGFDTAFSMLGTEMYRTIGSYNWSVLPFFVLMGYFCFNARFGEALFYAAYKWFGHLRGGMAVATIGACTAFAAIVGDSVSATATMGAVSLPQMKRFGYNDRLSAGCITAGASLGPIIPPSVVFIVYGLLTNMSIGDLFLAGLIPGILIAFCFIIIIYFWCRANPNAGPSGHRAGWLERLTSLKAVGPVIILFVIVIGGIYMGIFSPTEGGAIGAMVAFILGLIMKRWTKAAFARSLLDTGKVISMVFLMIAGGTLFSRFAAWCNLSNAISSLIIDSGLSVTAYMMTILIVLIIAGCFIDAMPLTLIMVPIIHPIAVQMGIDPIWFAMLVCISLNLGSITPPVGINLFVLKGLNKEMPMSTIYLGTMPFACGTLIAIVIIIIAPSIATWLPAVLK